MKVDRIGIATGVGSCSHRMERIETRTCDWLR